MTDHKFVVCKSGDYSTENRFYRECQERQTPHIVVTLRRKYASVSWDHISLPSALDKVLQADSAPIVDALLDVFHRHCGPRSKYAVNELVGSFDNLAPAAAETAAAEIYDLLMSRLCNRSAN